MLDIFGHIPKDVLLHFIVGVLLYALLTRLKASVLTALLVVLAVAIGKEVYDAGPSVLALLEPAKDIAATMLGASVIGYLIQK